MIKEEMHDKKDEKYGAKEYFINSFAINKIYYIYYSVIKILLRYIILCILFHFSVDIYETMIIL